jgi:hypothetical protein
MEKIKCIQIDVENGVFQEWEITKHHIETINELVGCDTIDGQLYDDNHIIYFDDNGWMNLHKKSGGFYNTKTDTFIVGNGLIVGHNAKTGENCDVTLSISDFYDTIEFGTKKDLEEILP